MALLPSLLFSKKLQFFFLNSSIFMNWSDSTEHIKNFIFIMVIYISHALILAFCFLLPYNYWKIIDKWGQIFFICVPISIIFSLYSIFTGQQTQILNMFSL